VSAPKSAFLTCVRVLFRDCDPLGHVNNAVYVGYLEQAAIDHAAAAGWPADRLQREAGAVFVARRHEIDFLRPAFENDVLEILTWPEAMSGARATRAYEVRRIDADPLALPSSRLIDGGAIRHPERSELVVTGRTQWAFADVERGRPVRIPASVTNDFLVEDDA
jgi:acyl-CoA thioester hydrolase